MADDSLGVLVEFQAKYDTVTQGFNQIAKGTDKVIENNKRAEVSFDELGRHAKEGANTILNDWLGLGIALSAAGLIEFFNHTAESISHLVDTARGLGVSAQDLQRLNYGAKLAGVGTDDLDASLKKFNISVGQALQGNEEMIASFKALGVNIESLRGKDIATQYTTVAAAASKLKDNNLVAANAMAVFGRNYTTALSAGRDGLADNIKEFDTLGVTLTDTQNKAVKAFDDSKTKLDTIFSGFFQKVVADSSPAFQKLIDGVTNFIQASGGIDGLATNVAQKIVDIVQSTIDTFNALKPGFEALLKVLGTLVDGAKAVFNSARDFANTASDIASNGSTNAHASNPGVTDFLADSIGYGHGWSSVSGVLSHIPLYNLFAGVNNPAFQNYDPNAGMARFNNQFDPRSYITGASYIPSIPGNGGANIPGAGSTTNPYDFSANTANAMAGVATAATKSKDALNTFSDAVQKSSDSITQGLKAMDDKLKNNELNKIFGILEQNNPNKDNLPEQPGQNFEKDAADLIQTLREQGSGASGQLYNSGLSLLRQDIMYNLQAGFSTNGMDQVIAEIEKFAQSLGVENKQQLVTISVAPTKDFTIKVLTNADAQPYIAAAVAGVAADAANQGANT